MTGLLSGLAGTTAMTATTEIERRLRPDSDLPVDYDATAHVVTAAARVLSVVSWQPHTAAQRRALFLLVHWGYGSAVAMGHRGLRARDVPPGPAAAAFFGGCQLMAFTLFPLLGRTPPPWRWRGAVLASSLGQHAVYVAGVATTDAVLDGARHVP